MIEEHLFAGGLIIGLVSLYEHIVHNVLFRARNVTYKVCIFLIMGSYGCVVLPTVHMF